ncbi:uncharacterized protein F4822DRAFT_390411 [Hypoxylon trugodes]|uniref:uncharacterized protein n=1 Tax=Hypoxylon trugodes TaxID=326681 RepID=UPI002195F7B2|nr:uncharacterized protein F4822DRAFT_390411 [Hypoxylon trugodes]KAI1392293.1 hypothetical protein F4822DRAFT_390411 [Hypoxylon trugodes]
MSSLILGRHLGLLRFKYHIPPTYILRRCISTQYASRNGGAVGFIGGLNEYQIHPGPHIDAFCKKHNILLPFSTTPLKGWKQGENICKLRVHASEYHCMDGFSMKYLDKEEHPFTKSVLNMYLNKAKEPLWFKAVSFPNASPFPCRAAAMRIKHAFYDALADRGYDKQGRKIQSDDFNVIAYLYGTVRITCADPKAACNIKFAELVEQVKPIVSTVVQGLGRDEKGSLIVQKPRTAKKFSNKNPKNPQSRPPRNPSGKSPSRQENRIRPPARKFTR